MGFNVSALPSFTQQGKAFIIKSILESQTIKTLVEAGSFDPTAKGIKSIQLLDTDVQIQDGSNCGFNASGNATLTQATLTVKDLKINQEYCVRVLEQKWAVGELQKGQDYTEMVFMEDIANLNSKQTSLALEQMVWVGDTGLTASANLNKIDGFVKQIKAGSYLPLTGATGPSTTLGKLQKINALMPVEVRSADDFRIIVGKDTFDQYIADLASLNIFKPVEDMTLFGTTSKLQVANGLNGGHVVATRLKNLQAGGEMVGGDAVEYKSWYSNDDDVIRISSRFSLAVTPIYINEIGYVKIA